MLRKCRSVAGLCLHPLAELIFERRPIISTPLVTPRRHRATPPPCASSTATRILHRRAPPPTATRILHGHALPPPSSSPPPSSPRRRDGDNGIRGPDAGTRGDYDAGPIGRRRWVRGDNGAGPMRMATIGNATGAPSIPVQPREPVAMPGGIALIAPPAPARASGRSPRHARRSCRCRRAAGSSRG